MNRAPIGDPGNIQQRLEDACSTARTLRHRDGATLYRQGEVSSQSFLAITGRIKLTRLRPDGQACVVAIVNAGDFFGLPLHVTEPAPLPDTALAKGAVIVCRIDTAELMRVSMDDPVLATHLVRSASKRLAFSEWRIDCLLAHGIEQRVAAMLVQLAGAYGGRCRHGHEIDMKLTQQELAEFVGATRPVVSSIMNRLREQDIVHYTRTYICIEQLEVLQRIGELA